MQNIFLKTLKFPLKQTNSFQINIGEHTSVVSKPYPLALKHYEWAREEINVFDNTGIVKTPGPWTY